METFFLVVGGIVSLISIAGFSVKVGRWLVSLWHRRRMVGTAQSTAEIDDDDLEKPSGRRRDSFLSL